MEAHRKDPKYQFLWKQTREGKKKGEQADYELNHKQLLIYQNKICIPNQMSLKGGI